MALFTFVARCRSKSGCCFPEFTLVTVGSIVGAASGITKWTLFTPNTVRARVARGTRRLSRQRLSIPKWALEARFHVGGVCILPRQAYGTDWRCDGVCGAVLSGQAFRTRDWASWCGAASATRVAGGRAPHNRRRGVFGTGFAFVFSWLILVLSRNTADTIRDACCLLRVPRWTLAAGLLAWGFLKSTSVTVGTGGGYAKRCFVQHLVPAWARRTQFWWLVAVFGINVGKREEEKRTGVNLLWGVQIKKKVGKNVNLPVLIWFAWSAFKKAPNGCKCIAWACFTEKWQFISHTGNIVMFPHGTPITFTCCWIVKLAREAAQNFAGTTNEFRTWDYIFPSLWTPNAVEFFGLMKHFTWICYLCNIPLGDICIKFFGIVKHYIQWMATKLKIICHL